MVPSGNSKHFSEDVYSSMETRERARIYKGEHLWFKIIDIVAFNKAICTIKISFSSVQWKQEYYDLSSPGDSILEI